LVRADAGLDPEGVHEVRVQALRLAVALELRGLRALRPDLRWLRGQLRRARDLDVALARELPLVLQARLSSERSHEQQRVRAAVQSPRSAGIVCGTQAVLQRCAPDRGVLATYATRMRELRRAALADPDDFEALHRLRRAVRRMRYGRAEFGLSIDAWAALQRRLGAACDAHAFLELARGLALEPAQFAELTEPIERAGRLRLRDALAHVREELADLLRNAKR
jgi:CHAD domain-containing protein